MASNRYSFRDWLNQPDYSGNAYIDAAVYSRDRYAGHGALSIADCSRAITLEFNLDDERDRANSLYKIDLLLKTLKEFKKALLVEMKHAVQLDKERQARGEEPDD